MKNGQIGVRVALELGPDTYPEDLDWTDLTDRVRSYQETRGRSDPLDDFPPGTATVELDNGDRMLDPSNPAGLVYAADGKGLPLCPVEIRQWWDGAWYTKFTGYVGPEAWPGGASPYGNTGTVTLNVLDVLGHSPGLPPDIWALLVSSMHPDWYSRMDDFEFPVLVDGSPIPDSITTGEGTVEGTTGISRAYSEQGSDTTVGVFAPGLLLSGDHQVRFPAAGIMPDGDQDKFTVALWWSPLLEIPAGERADVLKCVHPLTGLFRFSVYVDGDDGLAYVTTFDASETIVDTAVISPFVALRWDAEDLNRHVVVARWDAGDASKLTVWFGGVSADLNIPGDLYESDLIIGPNAIDTGFDEVAVWRRALDYENEIAVLFLSAYTVWAGQTFADRLGHWLDASGRYYDFDDTNQWHLPAGITNSLWGLVRLAPPTVENPQVSFNVTVPDTVADAFQTTVAYGAGVRWATKQDWLIRARTIHALTDPTYAESYATPVLFTDEDRDLDTGEFRHAGVDVTGLRIDRVINDASVKYLYSSDEPPTVYTGVPMVQRNRDRDSIARYKRRAHEVESEWADWPLNQTVADILVDRFAQPHQEIEAIRLDPTGTGPEAAALAEWLITTCDLELACDVTYTSQDADPVTVTGLNIQQIRTQWNPDRWSVELVAAKS